MFNHLQVRKLRPVVTGAISWTLRGTCGVCSVERMGLKEWVLMRLKWRKVTGLAQSKWIFLDLNQCNMDAVHCFNIFGLKFSVASSWISPAIPSATVAKKHARRGSSIQGNGNAHRTSLSLSLIGMTCIHKFEFFLCRCNFLNYRRNMVCLKCNCKRPKDDAAQYEDQMWRKPKVSPNKRSAAFVDDDGGSNDEYPDVMSPGQGYDRYTFDKTRSLKWDYPWRQRHLSALAWCSYRAHQRGKDVYVLTVSVEVLAIMELSSNILHGFRGRSLNAHCTWSCKGLHSTCCWTWYKSTNRFAAFIWYRDSVLFLLNL